MRIMRRKIASGLSLPTLRLEGSLFLPDQLEKAALGKASHQAETDYRIPKGLKLKDEYSRAFQIASAQWKHFATQKERQDLDSFSITQRFVVELLQDALGYQLTESHSVTLGERVYPVTYMAAHNVPVVIAPHTLDLDDVDERFAIVGSGVRKKSAFQLAQEFLNASADHLWALVSNGKQIRLLRDSDTLTRPSYIEFDIQDMLSALRFAEFESCWRLLHVSRANGGEAGASFWEAWRNEGKSEGTRVREGLREGVTQALLTLGEGYLQHPANEALRFSLLDGKLTKEAYFQQVLRLVYRLIFIFTVEERGLLHPEDDSTAAIAARRAYAQGYALARWRERCLKRRARNRFDDIWTGIKIVFRGLVNGEPRLALPPLGGLYAQDQCPDLDAAALSNAAILEAISQLRWSSWSGNLAPVDYRNMGSEELGSVYESLLELVPEVDIPSRHFGFVQDNKDTDRKRSSSYYTPDSLVQELIQTALDPLIETRIVANPNDPITALLSIKVCDPACGSGHFLLAAARRLAERLAVLCAPEGAVKPQDYRRALRNVVKSCIYGVDLNPLAVELCRISLWLEAFETGKPLGFLDSHIRCGNSLIGISETNLLSEAIPDNAFKALGDDDLEVIKAAKSTNRKLAKKVAISLRMLGGGLAKIEFMPEETLEDISIKRKAWQMAYMSEELRKERVVEDIYTAAFFVDKSKNNENLVLTNADLVAATQNYLRSGVEPLIDRIANKYKFFHWQLNFKQVFERDDGGFDLVIGNPPWDVVKKEDNDDYNEVEHDRLKLWYSSSIYSELDGKKDLYKLFMLLATHLVRRVGKVALVIPTGVFSEDKPIAVRKRLILDGQIERLSIYQNGSNGYFKAVHSSYLFATMVHSKERKGIVNYSTIKRYGEETRATYSVAELGVNIGEDLCLPFFDNNEAMRLYFKITDTLARYKQQSYRVTAELHASSDKSLIAKEKDSANDWTLLKNDGINQFNGKYGKPIGYIKNKDVVKKILDKGFSSNLLDEGYNRLVFRDIARSDDSRTLIACLLPKGYVSSYDIPLIVPIEDMNEEALGFLLGYFNSLVFDFLVRPHVDKHVKGYILARLPTPKYEPSNILMKRVSDLALELNKNCDGSYSNQRAQIDACIELMAGLNQADHISLFESFDVLRRSKIYSESVENYADLVLEMTGFGLNKKSLCLSHAFPDQSHIRNHEEAQLAGLLLFGIKLQPRLSLGQIEAIYQMVNSLSFAELLLDKSAYQELVALSKQYASVVQAASQANTTNLLSGLEFEDLITMSLQQGIAFYQATHLTCPNYLCITTELERFATLIIAAIAAQENRKQQANSISEDKNKQLLHKVR